MTNYNGLGVAECAEVATHTKNSAARLAYLTTDRGLLSPTNKEMKKAGLGPGTYSDLTKDAFLDKSFRRKTGSFGTASRDAHFSKYSSVH